MPTKPDTATGTNRGDTVLDLRGAEVHYRLGGNALSRVLGIGSRTVRAVDGIDVSLRRGEVLGLVGESGSGKTTLGRALLGLAPTTAGEITYRASTGDQVVSRMSASQLRRLRTEIQMVFQDPHAALNPSMDIETAVGHPLRIHGIASGEELRARVCDVLEKVGLVPPERYLSKFPSDLSGGQKQRAVIARAIILEPEVLVADEPVSMLDMSVRAKILQLMLDLKQDLGLTYVYITHDLASAKFFCDRIAIMYLGRIVEIGDTEQIFANPRHPYTRALLGAIPDPDPDRHIPRELPRGEIPDAAQPPLGCSFHPRCAVAQAECGWESRDLQALLEEHWTRRDPETYEKERALVGSLSGLDTPSTTARLGAGDPAQVRSLLDQIRAENPDEPLWRGVRSIEDGPKGVEITFHDPVDPGLRDADGVQVACVLYPEGEGSQGRDG